MGRGVRPSHGRWGSERTEREVNAKKVVTLAVVALLLFYLITEPQQSAQSVHTVLASLRD